MSMPLLHNIAYCNNIVAIQYSVSMYIKKFAQYTFIQDNQGWDKACVTRSKTHSVRPLSSRGVPRSQCTCSLLWLAQWLSVSVNTD